MDNKKTDQYYIDKIITDLTFIRTHTESLSKLKLEEDEILVDSIMFRLIQVAENSEKLTEIIYVFLTIFLYLLKCPQSLILSALRAFCFCGKPHISRSIFLYFRYQAWLKSW